MQEIIKNCTNIYKNTKGSLYKKVFAVCAHYKVEVIIDSTLKNSKTLGYAESDMIFVQKLKEIRHSFIAFHELAHSLFHLRETHNKTAIEMEFEADNFAKELFLAIYGKKNEFELCFLLRTEKFIENAYSDI